MGIYSMAMWELNGCANSRESVDLELELEVFAGFWRAPTRRTRNQALRPRGFESFRKGPEIPWG